MGDKLHKAARIMDFKNIDEFYFGLLTHWKPEDIVLEGIEPKTCLNGLRPELTGLDDIQKMMVLDSMSYLPDDILVKVDRAAMAVSLETRVPFLDHRLIEFCWRLPQHMKIKQGTGKWILREILHKYVPENLVNRPKMGFGVPIDSWLRGPLRDWAEELLNEKSLANGGLLDPKAVRLKWNEHMSGKQNWQHLLWNVLMFQAWLNEQ